MKSDNAGSHGGKRSGAGRKAKLDPATRLEIAIEYRGHRRCAAAAEALGKDPVRQRRKRIFDEISAVLAPRVSGELRIEEMAEYSKRLRNQSGLEWGDLYKPRVPKFHATPHGKGQGHWRKYIIA